jgi:hypothetical protein
MAGCAALDTAVETDADDEAIIEAFIQRRNEPDGEDSP